MSGVYPLVFETILKEKVWGGRALERLGKSLAPGKMVGESWEVADLAATSADGGGGAAERSVVANGAMKGRTVHEVMEAWGTGLMGSLRPSAEGGFPLLVKYLDAQENLSVQVHPSPEYARAHRGAHLKTESWYIVDAKPGAVIYKGIRAGVTRGMFEKKLRAGASIVEDLIAIPVRAGDCHHLPSGTCHALGAGVLVAEVQTPSDTTYRVCDWGRTGRALHVEQAMACIQFGPPERVEAIRSDGSARCELVRTSAYTLAELRVRAGERVKIEIRNGKPVVWMAISAAGTLRSPRGDFSDVEVRRGVTVLLPAGLGEAEFIAGSGEQSGTVLEAGFPG
ncbi:MAG TPA: type I phosphomannose isomerase catalytic subunit [Phycisphaerales bacterium]|nr:type I phosphomannose isomerase catalytic subunit [Phycisphaerales bacterium]